jgi:hypothetical protein
MTTKSNSENKCAEDEKKEDEKAATPTRQKPSQLTKEIKMQEVQSHKRRNHQS